MPDANPYGHVTDYLADALARDAAAAVHRAGTGLSPEAIAEELLHVPPPGTWQADKPDVRARKLAAIAGRLRALPDAALARRGLALTDDMVCALPPAGAPPTPRRPVAVEIGPSPPAPLSTAARAFIRYAADVAEENAEAVPLESLLDAAIAGAAAVMRLGVIPTVTELDAAQIASRATARFEGRAVTARDITEWLRAVGAE